MRLCPCFLDCNTIQNYKSLLYFFAFRSIFNRNVVFHIVKWPLTSKKNNISLLPNKYRIKQDLISLWQMNDNLYLCKLNMDSIGDGNKCD